MTEELSYSCNFKNCKQNLTEGGWVTICSHAFCENHGRIASQNNTTKVCPACGSNIYKKYNIVKMNASPSEEYKSMVLAGLKPEIIFDICQRALGFWNYQIQHEQMYKNSIINKFREKLIRSEEYFKDFIDKLENIIRENKIAIKNLEQKIDLLKTVNMELNGQLNEKNIEISKLKIQLNTFKRIYQEKKMYNNNNNNEDSFMIGPKI